MGFERVTAIIQGTKNLTDFSGTISNYETDIFRPIFDELEKLSGKKYASTLPVTRASSPLVERPSRLPATGLQGVRSTDRQDACVTEKIDIAFRVIADHIRTLSFAIADGIIPSNEGRGYVLRRILRRAIRYGRTLGFHEPFFFKLVDVVAQTMGDVFPEVRARQKTITEIIRREEQSFNKTLDRGIEEFNKAIADRSRLKRIVDQDNEARGVSAEVIFPSRVVFKLYDTYGFPLDLIELMAREQGFTVIAADFEKRMEEQRARARAAQKKSELSIHHIVDFKTKFVGYDRLEADAKLFKIVEKFGGMGSGDKWAIVDVSPFYAESGGQVGDTGELRFVEDDKVFRIVNTLKEAETFYLKLEDVHGFDSPPEAPIHLSVDAPRRQAIKRHHTVTHLLHWALREVVSRDAAQKGSYVGPDKLTFDFSSSALTPPQKRDVEKLVNDKIREDAPVSTATIPYAEARKRKDIQQFFGEKYGDQVRVIQIGGEPEALNGYSMELCGGTHVRSTGEIGTFRIVREEAIAAGIRRIEAVAGDAARAWAEKEAARQQERFETLARKKSDITTLPAFESNADTSEMLKQLDARDAHLEKLEREVREWGRQNAKAVEAELKSEAARIANELAASHAGKNFCVAEVPNADGKLLQAVLDRLKSKFKGPIFLVGAREGNVALIAAVPKELTSNFQANKIIQQIAPIVGGKGGGRPDIAQGAGKDASKIDIALAEAKKLLS
jgi:alanyl-tRNA synthetase